MCQDPGHHATGDVLFRAGTKLKEKLKISFFFCFVCLTHLPSPPLDLPLLRVVEDVVSRMHLADPLLLLAAVEAAARGGPETGDDVSGRAQLVHQAAAEREQAGDRLVADLDCGRGGGGRGEKILSDNGFSASTLKKKSWIVIIIIHFHHDHQKTISHIKFRFKVVVLKHQFPLDH